MPQARFQELADQRPTLILIDDDLIYAGPPFDLTPHCVAVTTIAIAIDSPFELEIKGQPALPSRAIAVIPARTLHHLRAPSRMAFVYTGMRIDGVAPHMLEPAQVAAERLMNECQEDAQILAHASALLAMLAIPKGVPSPAVSLALRKMTASPWDFRTAEQTAAHVALPTQLFRRRVKRETGMTFGQHRQRALVHAALRALAQGENLTFAAHSAGFSSSAHLSSTVRRMFGLMPSRLLKAGVRVVVGKRAAFL